ncbi:biotin/lipoate A/B protein ligase family protein [Listeria sp. PSOL-1]|uniref:lipoyl-[GcvH]:protein N-lipoyltransferase n=1 Tax=Listeria sp. PSOL-1 TaxID=1844999 RepID=UPI00272E5F7F|nr:biotin/lipoate A/B protein ligase family protein [Listeria sp. PSOL-1]
MTLIENTLLRQARWRFIDQTTINPAFSALGSYATDDTLCRMIGAQKEPPTARVWVHEKTVSLGIQDTKLPYLAKGIAFLQQAGYQVVLRNSGGLAVVLDPDILNLSLVFRDAERGIAINRGYETMYTFIKDMFSDYSEVIEAKEIEYSYCPGSYDLSISGKKFAGISQRRLAKGVAVQIYLGISGDQEERAKLIRQFYEISGKDEIDKYHFPDVKPEVMGTLSELLSENLSVNDIVLKLLNSLRFYADELYSATLTAEELDLFSEYYERIVLRNEKIK